MTNFSKDERNVIAEFVFSYHNNIVLKSDLVDLIEVFEKHDLIKDADQWKEDSLNGLNNMTTRLGNHLRLVITSEQVAEIMNEYYKINNNN